MEGPGLRRRRGRGVHYASATCGHLAVPARRCPSVPGPMRSLMPVRRSTARAACARRGTLLALAAIVPAVAAGCIRVNTKGYPEVERSDVLPLVAPASGAGAGGAARDTAWALARPPLTIVGHSRRSLDAPAGLTSVARSWERMFGAPPTPATVVLVELSDRGRAAEPAALPDSLAGRPTIWVPTLRWDDRYGERRTGPPIVASGGNAALQLAQVWLDARLPAEGSAAVPPWLRAGLVDALGGNEVLPVPRRRRSTEIPRWPLDTLLARRCAEGWNPVPRWRPRAAAADSTAATAPDDRAEPERRDRNDRSDPERALRENLRAPCGLGLRLQAGSFVRFLMDRGGDPMAERVLRTHLQGGTLEQAVAGAPGLPQTTAELERAWRAWELERIDDLRRAAGR